jgi:hypothetical protein
MSHFCIYQAQYLIVFSDTLSYPPYFNDAGSPGAEGAWVRGSLSGACWEHAHAEPGGLLGAARGTWEPAGSLLGACWACACSRAWEPYPPSAGVGPTYI